jgi:hypothetical protein
MASPFGSAEATGQDIIDSRDTLSTGRMSAASMTNGGDGNASDWDTTRWIRPVSPQRSGPALRRAGSDALINPA